MKRNRQFGFFLGVVVLVLMCFTSQSPLSANDGTSHAPDTTLNFEKISALLLERMNLHKGEKVLLLIKPGRFDAMVPLLKKGINNKNAHYLGAVSVTDHQPDEWKTLFTEGIEGLESSVLKDYLKTVDLGVMLPGPTPDDLVYKLLQDNLRDERGRTIHFHWAGAYHLDGSLREVDSFVDAAYQGSLLTTDYEALARTQQDLEAAMRNQTIRVTSPAGTDISFSIGDRPVTKQNGDASKTSTDKGRNLIDREIELPAGAIRVAPIEETVNGVVVFPDGQWNGEEVRGLTLTFEQGIAVSIEAAQGVEHALAEIDAAGKAGRSFRELALGLNPTLAIPNEQPWIPYYGYGAGVVRLSLGDNTELGGNVSGAYVRWNFFVDTSLKIGDEWWIKDGKLIR